jgi:hypothetical protein
MAEKTQHTLGEPSGQFMMQQSNEITMGGKENNIPNLAKFRVGIKSSRKPHPYTTNQNTTQQDDYSVLAASQPKH